MSLVSYGELDKEVESYLGLTKRVSTTDEEGRRVIHLIGAIESFICSEDICNRKFLQDDYTHFVDVRRDACAIPLKDRPVSTFTKIEYVTSRSSEGVVTLSTLPAYYYSAILDKGYVLPVDGYSFPYGNQMLKLTYTAGITASGILNNGHADVTLMKELVLTLLAREYGLSKETKRHIQSISYDRETVTYLFDLDGHQKRLIEALRIRTPQTYSHSIGRV